MAKKEDLMFKIGVFDKKHRANIKKRLKAVEELLDKAAKDAARISETSGFTDAEKPFYFADYPEAEKHIDELMRSVSNGLKMIIEEGDKEEWLLSCDKNDAIVDSITAASGLPKEKTAAWKQRNLEALAAFRKRKEAGMDLSKRVWNITGQLKQELELALDIGLGEGKSAAELSRDVRKYLNNPDSLFRRVRDKHGNLRLSKAAKAYHPGQGVYRSSYKNALRLTATETNMAYRRADYERWQKEPWVVGINIKIAHKGHPVYDICDELQGDYPKDFLWLGWHPHCNCAATPIRAPESERMDYLQKMADGEDVSGYKFSGKVKDVPDNFNAWLNDNESRINNMKSIPYFMKDNPKYSGVATPRVGAGTSYAGTKLGRSATKAAYKEYEGSLPPTLSAEQKANIDQIAREMGIAATPMPFLEADSGKGNVNYGKGESYGQNCQCCVAVHEARLRGLNVTSLGYNGTRGSASYKLGEHFEAIWQNPKTGKTPAPTHISAESFDDLIRKVYSHTKAVGRYHIGINMSDNKGHVITAERLPSGKMIFYDAQSGVFLNLEEYAVSGVEYMEVLKVDKFILRPDIFKQIARLL